MLLAALFTMTALEGCPAHVTITDSEVVGNMPDGRGALFHTMTPAQEILSREAWDQKRVGWISVPPEWFAENKVVVEYLCHKTSLCDYKTQERISLAYERAWLAYDKAHDREPSRKYEHADFQFKIEVAGRSPSAAQADSTP